MDIVIADAEMRTAAGAIEDALYQLSSICSRAVPIIKGLQDTGALSSENLDEKYQQQLADHLNALATTALLGSKREGRYEHYHRRQKRHP